MSKNWFPHDYNTVSDPKISLLLSEFGGMGYAVFWRIIEMLHSEASHSIPRKKYIYFSIAKQLLTTEENVQKIIEFCCGQCELFVCDDENIWSEFVLNNIREREEKYEYIREKRADAGRKGGLAKASNNLANARNVVANASKSYQNVAKPSHKTRQDITLQDKTNIKENITHKHIVRSTRTSDFDSSKFDQFWDAYHPVGRVSRKKTVDIWKKQKLDQHIDKILNHLEDLRKTHNWINNQYIPHATTFLDDERWKEKVIEQKPVISMMTKEQKRKEDFREALYETYADPFSISPEEDNAEKIINPLD